MYILLFFFFVAVVGFWFLVFFRKEKPKVREMHLPTLLILKVQFRAHMVGLHLGQDTSGYS